ncbi:hypothetical protein FRC07_008693 [Ceratobasidium sp. 392]|nr:hypothetical protein FRC07_008693 [Ceratobasidium sp. 392]
MNLSYTSNHLLNTKVNNLLKGSKWKLWSKVIVGDWLDTLGKKHMSEIVTMLGRDAVGAVAQLVNEPTLSEGMVFAPKRAFVDAGRRCQIYNEMWTGEAWEKVQSELPEGATVIPVIISSDKTHLTSQQGCKEAWPVYLSIGNIPKSKRAQVNSGATVLLGQLPVTNLEVFEESRRGEEESSS